jgi:hypothetical protein
MFGGHYGELSPVPIDEAARLISFAIAPFRHNGARLVPSRRPWAINYGNHDPRPRSMNGNRDWAMVTAAGLLATPSASADEAIASGRRRVTLEPPHTGGLVKRNFRKVAILVCRGLLLRAMMA